MTRQLPETVLVGRIIRPHGLGGDVVVAPASDVDERFDAGQEVRVYDADGRFCKQTIAHSSDYKDRLLVGFENCRDRDGAEKLRGCELRVAKQDVPGAPAGEYYFFELLDCRCRERHEGDLGPVVGILEDGGGLLLEVDRGNRKVLIPFVRDFVRDIDIERGHIELELPPGLLETCASTS